MESEEVCAVLVLERARSQHDTGLRMVKYDRLLQALRGDARYAAFLRKMNFPANLAADSSR